MSLFWGDIGLDEIAVGFSLHSGTRRFVLVEVGQNDHAAVRDEVFGPAMKTRQHLECPAAQEHDIEQYKVVGTRASGLEPFTTSYTSQQCSQRLSGYGRTSRR